MDKSIFLDKNKTPENSDLKASLGASYVLWQLIKDAVFTKYPKSTEEWSFSTYGWSFRIKDTKRAIVYLLPRNQFFKVAFVFGQKATDEILVSKVSSEIKTELSNAKVYAEGRGIRIDIHTTDQLEDVFMPIDVKLRH